MFSKSERNAKTSSMGRSIGMVFSNSSTSSSFSQIGTIMTSKEVGCMPREPYSPECVEMGLLGSSHARYCIQPVLYFQDRAVAGCGSPPVQTPCNTDG